MSSFPCESSDRHAFCHVVRVGMSDDSCAFGIQPCVAVGVVEVSVRTAARRRSATVTTWITTRPMSPPSWVLAARTHCHGVSESNRNYPYDLQPKVSWAAIEGGWI